MNGTFCMACTERVADWHFQYEHVNASFEDDLYFCSAPRCWKRAWASMFDPINVTLIEAVFPT